ncbi:hypothetical protein [Ensifer adhaerens]|uniref:hypothetical protein n=1 Tax=Ensifer adhaerens TaxID=106592 RepID=UPI00132E9930|nr:hypothetical protein [Ensifer adhaerens]QHG70191.1 hypothetical protein DQW09_10180 [Ensifer adhaerens]
MSAEGQTIPDDMAQRVARLINEAEDMRAQAVDDLKTIYGDLREELKSLGWLGQNISKEVAALKGAIAEMRLDDEKKAKLEEKGDRVDDYVSILSRGRARAPARARENIEQSGAGLDPKLAHTIVTGLQTETGRAALVAAVDILIEREEAEERRSDAGLDIVTKHTEIATNEGGANQGEELAQGSTPDLEPSGPDVNGHPNSPEEANEACRASQDAAPVTGRPAEPVNSLPTEGCGYAHTEGNATQSGVTGGETPPSFLTKPPSPLRPHCQRPEMCAGVGRTHCHTCSKAMREQEEFA